MAAQTPEYLSPTVVSQAQTLLDQGDVSGAWQALADHGDTYADNAAAVTGGATTADDLAYQYMVENHWSNTTGGPDAYNNYFDDVAKTHLQNYLNLLNFGVIPSSNQIVGSYIDSLGKVGLPPSTAFDRHKTSDRVLSGAVVPIQAGEYSGKIG